MDSNDGKGGRYSAVEKAAAVRVVRTLRTELGDWSGNISTVSTATWSRR